LIILFAIHSADRVHKVMDIPSASL